MSGFKTPTAMSPPKKQDSSPRFCRPTGTMHPYDGTPTLMQAFEQLKSNETELRANAKVSNMEPTPLSAVEQGSKANGGRPVLDRASSATFPLSSAIQESRSASRPKPVPNQMRAATVSPLSAMRLGSMFCRHRTHTAPLPNDQDLRSAEHPGNGHTTASTPPSSHSWVSSAVSDNSPSSKSPLLPSPYPDLEVYKRHESNGRLMVCEAREMHCSITVARFLGEWTGLTSMEELKADLLGILGRLGEGGKEQARLSLKVATGNMLERVVAWDLNKAEALEQSDVPLLSTVPTAESLNRVDASYILKVFRLGMRKIPSTDIRYKVGMLPDVDLMALLHFTLLVSRPVLAWELDLDEI